MEGKDDRNRETDKRWKQKRVPVVSQLCPDVRTDARMFTWQSHKFFFLSTEVFPDVNIWHRENTRLQLFKIIHFNKFFFMLTAHENDYSICVENALQPRLLFTGSLEWAGSAGCCCTAMPSWGQAAVDCTVTVPRGSPDVPNPVTRQREAVHLLFIYELVSLALFTWASCWPHSYVQSLAAPWPFTWC